MRAVVLRDPGSVEVVDVPDARIENPGDAVVRVTVSAICGSDLHAYHRRLPIEPGESMGHEAVGVIESVGSEVERFRPGDRVVLPFGIICGRCWYCRRGDTSLCDRFRYLGFGAFGGGLAGVQAEAVRVPIADVNLLGVPDGMDDERALFVGDILTTGVYGAALAAGASGTLDAGRTAEPGSTVAVVGAGPVGFFVAQAARLVGFDQVLVLDRVADRLAVAAGVGATPIDVGADDARQAVRERTDGRGADVGVEAVGNLEAYASAMSVTRRGGRIVVIGVYGDEHLDVRMSAYWTRGVKLAFGGVCPVHAWWERALAAVADGAIDPMPIVSHRLPLADAAEGYRLFDSREATKVLLRP